MRLRSIYELVRDTALEWWNDTALRRGARVQHGAVAVPILLITIAVSGLVCGEEAAHRRIVAELRDVGGREGANAIEAMVANAWSPSTNLVAAAVGLVTLLLGAEFTQVYANRFGQGLTPIAGAASRRTARPQTAAHELH